MSEEEVAIAQGEVVNQENLNTYLGSDTRDENNNNNNEQEEQ